MNVTIYKGSLRTEARWIVSRYVGGRQKRTYCKTRSEAEAEASRLRDEIAGAGKEWLELSASDKTRLMLLLKNAKDKGVDLDRALAAQPITATGPNLGKAIDELIAGKKAANRSQDYIANLRLVLSDFAQTREHINIAHVTFSDVESFLNRKTTASRSTLRSRLSALFEFSIRRGWRPDNPCDRLEHVKVVARTPAIFTLEQLKKCLGHFKESPRGYAWFVLSTLCGLRPEEAEKTRKADISFKEGWIKVEAQTTKIAQRRVVYPRPEALGLLKRAVRAGGELPLDQQPRRRVIRRLREVLGWKAWPKDVTRHTCASYWLPVSTSATVSEALGNSEKTLNRHYKALVTKEQAAKFWQTINAL